MKMPAVAALINRMTSARTGNAASGAPRRCISPIHGKAVHRENSVKKMAGHRRVPAATVLMVSFFISNPDLMAEVDSALVVSFLR